MPKWKNKSIKRLARTFEPKSNVADEFFLPNTSGDHERGIKRAAPVDDADLVNKSYVDTQNALYLPLVGGTLTGGLWVQGDYTFPSSVGSILFGATTDAAIGYNGTNLIINPNITGSGKVLIGATGEDDLCAGSVKIGVESASNVIKEVERLGAYGIKIGSGTAVSHTMGDGFLSVTGRMECKNYLFTDGILWVRGSQRNSNGAIYLGDSTLDAGLIRNGAGLAFHLFGDATDANFVFTDNTWRAKDHDHPSPDDPTVFIHSATNPDTDNTQWLGFTHDKTDGVISTGKGDLLLKPIGGDVKIGADKGLSLSQAGSTSATVDAPLGGLLQLKRAGVLYAAASNTGNWEVTKLANYADDVTFTGDGSGLLFAELSIYNNSTADNVATGTWVQMTRFDTDGESNGCTPDHTNDHITVLTAGRYKVSMSCSFSGDPNIEWFGGVFTNNGGTQHTNAQAHRKLGAGGDVGSVSVTGILDLAVNDTIEIWFRHEAGVNKNIVVVDCTLNAVMIGGT